MSGESALTVRNAAMGSGARGAASAAFVIENRFRQVGGEAPAAPIGAEIKSEVTDDENYANHTRLRSENLQQLDQLAKKEGGLITVDIHTCVAPVTPSLIWVSSKRRLI